MQVEATILYDEIREQAPDQGLYVWVDPAMYSVLQIQRLIKGAPFKTQDMTEVHCTVLFHKGHLAPDLEMPADRPMMGEIRELAIWTDHKQRQLLVALLDAPDLMKLHSELKQSGLTHTFDDYVPHITLSKNAFGDDPRSSRLWIENQNQRLRERQIPVSFGSEVKASSAQ